MSTPDQFDADEDSLALEVRADQLSVDVIETNTSIDGPARTIVNELLVHAAGNDAKDNDAGHNNFPTAIFSKSGWFSPKKAKNWIEVGALSWKKGEDAVATFSNFGGKNVDVFAPGVDIYSTAPDGKYKNASGTSMASPVTAGVASMIRSYFPELTAEQVKECIEKSVVPQDYKVKKPGSEEMVKLSSLCRTGGTVNAYKAVQLASQMKGKKKVANRA